MRELMSTNIYEFSETLIVCGRCLSNMDKLAFKQLEQISDNVYSVCLETIHMNMVAHKVASILRLGKLRKLIFASVDKSPHCIQLHYIRQEVGKIVDLSDINIKNYISKDGKLVEISDKIIALSKDLNQLSQRLS